MLSQAVHPGRIAIGRLDALLQQLSSSAVLAEQALFRDGSLVDDHRIKNQPTSPLTESCPDFGYRRLLPAEKTRLLVLEPGRYEDELKGRLKHVRSLQDHEYEALSYVWGESSGTHTLQCSAAKLHITPNLDAALRKIRFSDASRVLWVDAVCIDQSNLIERSRQVRIMREIYTNAKQVLIWLGESSQADARAFQSLLRLHHQVKPGQDSFFLVRLGWYRDKGGRVFSGGAHRSMMTDVEYEHLVNQLSREWFHRTWVIQEVASAKRATVLCGDESMPWDTFADVYMRLGDHFLPVTQLGGEYAHQSLENISAIENARRSHSGPLSMSLFHILVATSFSKCKDQRDKIYAVLGLAKDWKNNSVLIPDYNTSEKKVFETFKEFAIADTNQNRSLRLLSCASGPSSTSLPSWVPDWRYIDNTHPFVRYSERTRFSTSGGMKPDAWHSENGNVLRVTGKFIDSIQLVGSEPSFTKAIAIFEINEEKIKELQKSFDWLQECQDIAGDQTGFMTAQRHHEFWRTMTCGLNGDGFPAPPKYGEYFFSYVKFMETAPKRFEDYLIESRTAIKGVRGMDEVIPRFETHAVIEASLHRWASRRRFCKTQHGRIAFVPKTAMAGDIICVFFGGEVPYVLRPSSDSSFAVVGECYVDDIMHGESLSDDAKVRQFRLR